MTSRIAEYSRPSHTILHISDTHLRASGLLYDRVDALDRLRRIVDSLIRTSARTGESPDAVVFTGDLADRGEALAYGMLRTTIEPAIRALGAQPIWLVGEHDDRSAFRTTLLGQAPSTDPIFRSSFVNGLRIISLDTSVLDETYGNLDETQLDWLSDELATAAPNGTILAMHHPPLPSVNALDASTELRCQRELAEVLTGSDVRSILAGHLHYSSSASFAGIPVSVASSTAYTQDLQTAPTETRVRDGAQSYNLVQVYDHAVMHTVVPVGESSTLEHVSAQETARLLAVAGIAAPTFIDDELGASTVWELSEV